MAQTPKRAVIYTRVSLDQTGEGRSVERQLAACRALATARGWQVDHELSETVSAWSGRERAAWDQVLALIDEGQVDVVVAWHIDRMTRSMVDLENLILLAEAHGVGIATATGDIDLTTDVGRMVARILAAVARAEVERKSARQRLANQQRAAEGRPADGGKPPFGWAADKVTTVPEQVEIIQGSARDLLAGASLAEVARRWSMDPSSVKKALLSPRMIGLREYRGETYPAQWQAVLEEDQQLALSLLLNDRARTSGEHQHTNVAKNLLTGLAVCGKCGRACRAGATVSSRGPTYNCRQGCVYVLRDEADDYVGSWVVATLAQPEVLSELLVTDDEALASARSESEEARARLDVLAEAFAAGDIDRDQLTSGSTRLRAMLERSDRVLAQAAGGTALADLSLGTPRVAKQWLGLELYRQRALVDLLFDVTFLPTARKRAPFVAAERIRVERSVAT